MPILAEGSLDLLAVNPGLLIWTVITFVAVLVVLYLTAWKPILKAIDERNDKIEADIEKSREIRESAEKLLKEYEEKLQSARDEAHEIIEEARKDATANKDKILDEARAETEQIRKRLETEIEQAKVKALDEIEHSTVDLAVKVIGSVLQNQVGAGDHKAMIERELSNIKN